MNNTCNLTVVGRIGRDAEVKTTKNGKTTYLEFSIAVSSDQPGQGPEREEITHWYNCQVFGEARARGLQKIITKGEKVLVSGKFTPSLYVDKSGVTKQSLRIAANDVERLTWTKAEPFGAPLEKKNTSEFDSDDGLPF